MYFYVSCVQLFFLVVIREYVDQSGKVVNPARGQLNKENYFSLSPFAPENLVSRDGFGRLVPSQPAYSPYSG